MNEEPTTNYNRHGPTEQLSNEEHITEPKESANDRFSAEGSESAEFKKKSVKKCSKWGRSAEVLNSLDNEEKDVDEGDKKFDEIAASKSNETGVTKEEKFHTEGNSVNEVHSRKTSETINSNNLDQSATQTPKKKGFIPRNRSSIIAPQSTPTKAPQQYDNFRQAQYQQQYYQAPPVAVNQFYTAAMFQSTPAFVPNSYYMGYPAPYANVQTPPTTGGTAFTYPVQNGYAQNTNTNNGSRKHGAGSQNVQAGFDYQNADLSSPTYWEYGNSYYENSFVKL
ncbi:unnamed protein product [Ambrosiozyma monospora]|uniref:Unnamed protein product n=1 Tax=Ambrosiozyma monospora TaxID=43982 RepID=A0ACB5T1L8_AMBMO|nr:unnamed protein product [Ambrosiozyma monospora]